ncbi:hypothetical protein GIS00_15810 [Nakamurella sp. YIM 132087]|uniref:Uncharacterized protein n=1 Tax=Nakamurella alba TaxID=2665158 RepID=A0A7K1FRH1_9ACTN|nr:hypothetical protein [Nakamurella alba]MTD15404.1 hypothetical protein [Nakamurella alba]
MSDGHSTRIDRPDAPRGRWNSFVGTAAGPNGVVRGLVDPGNDRHRVRVEFDGHTVLLHLSDETGTGWTTIAVDRAGREWGIAQRDVQLDAAVAACRELYRG